VKPWLVAALVAAAACTPIKRIDRFDGDFAHAKEKRRVLALASPT
jgi:hypothetical protein